MLVKIGIGLMIWLIAGFLIGVKWIFLDGLISKENIERTEERTGKFTEEQQFLTTKSGFLAMVTAMGLIAFLIDISRIFRGA